MNLSQRTGDSLDSPPRILIVCTDLIFSTKITGTAKALGRTFAVARALPRLEELLAAGTPALVIIDLAAAGIDPLEAIRRAKAQSPARVVAFLSHIETELAAEALGAGADSVMARSAFSVKLPEILTGV